MRFGMIESSLVDYIKVNRGAGFNPTLQNSLTINVCSSSLSCPGDNSQPCHLSYTEADGWQAYRCDQQTEPSERGLIQMVRQGVNATLCEVELYAVKQA